MEIVSTTFGACLLRSSGNIQRTGQAVMVLDSKKLLILSLEEWKKLFAGQHEIVLAVQ